MLGSSPCGCAARLRPRRRLGSLRLGCGLLPPAPAAGAAAASPRRLRAARPAPLALGAVLRRLEVRDLDALVPALGDGVRQDTHDQAGRADGVVVSGDHEVGLVGVAVGVHQPDHRDVQAPRLAHGQRLLLHVDDDDGVRQLAGVGHAAEVGLELLQLGQGRPAAPWPAAARAGPPTSAGAARAGRRSAPGSCGSWSAGRPASGGSRTAGRPAGPASSTASWHCFLVPTKSTLPFRSPMLLQYLRASSQQLDVCCRSMM